MGEFDDGFKDEPEYEIINMWRIGSSDGYTHSHGGPLYKTFDAAKIAGERQHGNYNVEPKAYPCIQMPDGKTFIVEGPVATADEVALENEVRERLLNRLTPYEKKLLGIKS